MVPCALSSEPFRRFPHAVCGLSLLLPQNSSLLHRLRVDGTLLFESETLAPQPCGHNSLGEASFSRASGRRLHVVAGLVLRGPSLPESSFGKLDQSPLGCLASHVCDFWLLRPLLSLLSRNLVFSGYQSTTSALCWSTCQRNRWSPSCRVVAGSGVASRAPVASSRCLLISRLILRLLSSSLTVDSSRSACRGLLLFVGTRCGLILIFTSKLSCRACTFVVGSRCRLISSFVSRLAAVVLSLTQAVVCRIRCLCVSFVTLCTLLCWAACWPRRCSRPCWIWWGCGSPSGTAARKTSKLVLDRSRCSWLCLLVLHRLLWAGCVLAEVSCFCRVLACAVLSLTSFCLSVDTLRAVFTRRHSSRPRLVSLPALSWHSMMILVMSARQVRLHRLWLRVDHRWDGRIPDLHPLWLSHLCSRSRTTTLKVSAASGYSATATSRWTVVGRKESQTCTSCSPCRCVYGHVLTSSRSWTSLLHETVHRVTFQSDLALLILWRFSALDVHFPLVHFDLERLYE